MLSLEELRELEPELRKKTDAEVEETRNLLYQLAQLMLESYVDTKKKTQKSESNIKAIHQ
jgi:hypothetical protein